MIKIVPCFAALFALLVAGCATSPIPAGYTGPTAKLIDSSELETNYRGSFYFVSEVNGNRIESNLDAFRNANRGKGFAMSPGVQSRLVPAGPSKLKLEARNAYGAPIQELAMAATMRTVTDTIEVDLEPDEMYYVRGVLKEGKDEVWLESRSTGERVGKKVAR